MSQSHRRFSAGVQVAAAAMREQSAERVGLAASGAAFWLVISAFPTAIAVVSLYGLFVSPQRVATDLGDPANGVPGSLGSLLTEQLQRAPAPIMPASPSVSSSHWSLPCRAHRQASTT